MFRANAFLAKWAIDFEFKFINIIIIVSDDVYVVL